MDFPQWQLHRGFWKEGVRENTLAAFEKAKEMNCEMVEMDVQLSRDGQYHVFHDFSLKRMFHVNQKVGQTSSEDLSGLGIPLLKDILKSDQVPQCLNIEVKSMGLSWRRVKGLLELLRPFHKKKKVMVSSFNPWVIFWISRWQSELPRALIVGEQKILMSPLFDQYIKWTQPHFINCHYSFIDEAPLRDRVLQFKKPLMLWTVNDYSKARFYLKRGARSIISDLPPPQ
jgi:glycerophosphoryl diester phosphodiesterase